MRRYPLKVISGLFLAGTLAGCASPAVFVASQAASGVSYLTTGKGTTDHVLSAALAEDCALHRVINGDAVCRTEDDARPVQTASLGEWPPADDFADRSEAEQAMHDKQLAMAGVPGGAARANTSGATQVSGLGADMFFVPHAAGGRTGPIVRQTLPVDAPVASGMAAAPVAARPSVDAEIAPSATPAPAAAASVARPMAKEKRFYLVIASFSSRANALRAAERTPADARVVAAYLPDKTVYRVVLGPFDQERTSRARRQLAAAGGKAAWPIPACDGRGSKGCMIGD